MSRALLFSSIEMNWMNSFLQVFAVSFRCYSGRVLFPLIQLQSLSMKSSFSFNSLSFSLLYIQSIIIRDTATYTLSASKNFLPSTSTSLKDWVLKNLKPWISTSTLLSILASFSSFSTIWFGFYSALMAARSKLSLLSSGYSALAWEFYRLFVWFWVSLNKFSVPSVSLEVSLETSL